jgi:hypothetical protein
MLVVMPDEVIIYQIGRRDEIKAIISGRGHLCQVFCANVFWNIVALTGGIKSTKYSS